MCKLPIVCVQFVRKLAFMCVCVSLWYVRTSVRGKKNCKYFKKRFIGAQILFMAVFTGNVRLSYGMTIHNVVYTYNNKRYLTISGKKKKKKKIGNFFTTSVTPFIFLFIFADKIFFKNLFIFLTRTLHYVRTLEWITFMTNHQKLRIYFTMCVSVCMCVCTTDNWSPKVHVRELWCTLTVRCTLDCIWIVRCVHVRNAWKLNVFPLLNWYCN